MLHMQKKWSSKTATFFVCGACEPCFNLLRKCAPYGRLAAYPAALTLRVRPKCLALAYTIFSPNLATPY